MFAGARLKQTHSCRKEGAVSIVCFEAGDGRLFYFRGRRGGLNYPPPLRHVIVEWPPKRLCYEGVLTIFRRYVFLICV